MSLLGLKALFGLCVVDQPETRPDAPEPVEADELNAWKRGFTPQAEIWNGRLATVSYTHLTLPTNREV